MAVNYKDNMTGVFGYPVAENPTCVMQQAAFDHMGLRWRYLTIEVKPEDLPTAVAGMRAMGFMGINLTIPHKVAVMPLLDDIAPDAQMIGAVNTVRREGDRYIGENTDGKGFLRGVREEAGVDPKGKRVVLLGAGGAARAIAVELALAGAAEIEVVNRSPQRGEAMLLDLVARTHVTARLNAWDSVYRVRKDADILVNATSIGLYPDVDAMPNVALDDAAPHLLVCDVIPNPPNTPFMREAAARGLKTLDGLSMLVYQGVIGFQMWTGENPPEAIMKDALKAAFGV
ncbi:MAG: shikimate dehydrogenase [Chloroflexota bacterium]|nr:shikimate dehydrogenase [Chloroflexota bacterium]